MGEVAVVVVRYKVDQDLTTTEGVEKMGELLSVTRRVIHPLARAGSSKSSKHGRRGVHTLMPPLPFSFTLSF